MERRSRQLELGAAYLGDQLMNLSEPLNSHFAAAELACLDSVQGDQQYQ